MDRKQKNILLWVVLVVAIAVIAAALLWAFGVFSPREESPAPADGIPDTPAASGTLGPEVSVPEYTDPDLDIKDPDDAEKDDNVVDFGGEEPGPTPDPTPGSTPKPTPAPTPSSTPAPTPGATPGTTPEDTASGVAPEDDDIGFGEIF